MRGLRAERNWSQRELAARSRIDARTIGRIESGLHRSSASKTINRLCKAFAVGPDRIAPLTLPDPAEGPAAEPSLQAAG